jgi:hypothetical protein
VPPGRPTGRGGLGRADQSRHPDRPGFEDFGDVMWRGDRGTGYARVEWFTPGGLGTWGDGRLTILGSEIAGLTDA